MSVTIGIIAIIFAFTALIVLCFKGFSVMYVAPLCAIFIAVVCGLPLLETMTGSFTDGVVTGAFLQGVTSFIVPLLPVFMLSILIGRIYIASGAATNIARTLMNVFAKDGSIKRKQTVGVLICVVVSWIMCYGGIDTFCALFTLFPVILTVCAEANIPRKYMIGMITCGVSAAACTPGAPLVTNYVPMEILGTSSTAGLIPGLAALAIVAGGGAFYLIKSISKATANGEVFTPGNVQFSPIDPMRTYPPFIVALAPLVTVTVLFNVIGNLTAALAIGLVLALVLLPRYIAPEEGSTKGRTLIEALNEGGKTTAECLLMGGIIAGMASVIQMTDAYSALVDGVLNLDIPAAALVLIAVALLVGLTGSPPVALRIILPTLAAASVAISPEALHRIATVTSTTFDTLPFQSPIIIMLAMADLKHKDGYPPVMMCTVVMTGIASIVVALLFVLFPELG